ncbi:MAG: saccharopine dehydrogenase NADP-binding domain-containing protein [Acidobacteriota bacterium]|nr:saccharopine dehydrogenase NADP-binding domain-containing protein [Acidobacteriota bacterium]
MTGGGIAGRRAVALGAGRQGTCAAYDLAAYGGASEVTLVDADETAARAAAERLTGLTSGPRFTATRADAGDAGALADAMRGAVTSVCALPYRYGPVAAAAAVEARCSLVDLGGNTDVSARILELSDAAREAGVSLVPDTGLAPGLATTLAAAGVARLDEPRAVRIWCGGLPERPIPPFDYRLVFSIEGLFNEYSGDAVYLRGGRIVAIPALSELDEVELPGVGRVEAFPTSGGTSTAPDSFFGRLDLYEYRTVRYAGHRDRFRALADLGLLSDVEVEAREGVTVRPRELLARLLTSALSHPEIPDLVVLRVEVRGRQRGKPSRIVYDLLDREDRKTGFTAMERTTAHPAAVVAEMAAAGEISAGAWRLEVGVPPERFLERFAERPLSIDVKGPEPAPREEASR